MKLQRKCGYTLLELLIVCSLLSIFLALSIPTTKSFFSKNGLRSGGRIFVYLVENARNKAIRSQQPLLITINTSKKNIEVHKYNYNGSAVAEKAIYQSSLPDNVVISQIIIDGNNDKNNEFLHEIYVSPQGYINKTEITLEDYNGNETVIKFHSFWGSEVKHINN